MPSPYRAAMRLQWSEIRARASAFSQTHKNAHYEKGETHTFYNDFFDCFGVSRRQVATYEQRVRNLPGDKQGFIDLFWPGVLIVEQKSAGLDLKKPAIRRSITMMVSPKRSARVTS